MVGLHGLALLLVLIAVDQAVWLLLCLLVVFVSWRRTVNAYKFLGEVSGFVLQDAELGVLAGGERLAVRVCGNPVVALRCVAFSIRPESQPLQVMVAEARMQDGGSFTRRLCIFKVMLCNWCRFKSAPRVSNLFAAVLRSIFVPGSFPLLIPSSAMSAEDHRALRFYLLHLA